MAQPNPTPPTFDPPSSSSDSSPASRSWLAGRRKWAILALGLVLVAGGYFVWQGQTSPGTTTTNQASDGTTSTPTKKNSAPTFQQVTVPPVTDADKDGLTDEREAELKTNPQLADSDGDELSDYDEVVVYGTNPLAQDTDGDGFPDGAEVQSGNNPKGSGKILNLPDSISNINTQ